MAVILHFNSFDLIPCPAGDLRDQIQSTPPSPRYDLGFASVDNKLFVFGGYTSYGESDRGVERQAWRSGLV